MPTTKTFAESGSFMSIQEVIDETEASRDKWLAKGGKISIREECRTIITSGPNEDGRNTQYFNHVITIWYDA